MGDGGGVRRKWGNEEVIFRGNKFIIVGKIGNEKSRKNLSRSFSYFNSNEFSPHNI
jgi:hypothetical protein